MLLNGKKVFVGRFVPRKDREIELGEKAKMFTNVFIKNLSEDVEEGALLEMFEAFGKITSLKVMKGTYIGLIFYFCKNCNRYQVKHVNFIDKLGFKLGKQ